ncbi:MAG TPA: hypothetical protein VJ901_14845 [Thermoanaerobaculia bacterium]|nr:hypothetical protein [Thermoanaerobaculia bacterium]
MLNLERELDAVRNVLNERGIEYALCGGLAVGVHGFPRATVDIDLLIRPESEHSVYEAVGLLVSKIDNDGEVLMLDLLLVTPPFEHVWETRDRGPRVIRRHPERSRGTCADVRLAHRAPARPDSSTTLGMTSRVRAS